MDQVDHIMAIMDVAFDPQWGEAWNRRQVSDALVMPHTHAILIADDGTIWSGNGSAPAGFVMSRHAADEEELLLIGVVPKARGKGIGKALIKALFEHAALRGMAKVFLEMRSNNPAEHLYRQMGFEPIGQRRDYYRLADGGRMDAITFARMLDT